MMLDRLGRYAATVRHLKPSQILGRLWFRAYRPKPDLRPAPAVRSIRDAVLRFRLKQPSLTGPQSVTFLNQPGDISTPAAWQDKSCSLLWLYNLHYFDDLAAEGALHRVAWQSDLVHRWVAENPPSSGVGWQPYPTSLRIVNWIKWQLTVEALSQEANASLAVQVRHLRNRLEHHILGNHLLANAKALYLAGAYFSGPEADTWLSLGRKLLERELEEQILDDGAHFELSPMYHLIVLEDLLDVVNVGRAYGLPLPSGIESSVDKMLGWSRVMRHPDGNIPFFNDATLGIAATPADLDAYGARLGFAPTNTPDTAVMMAASGYVRLEAEGAVLFADIAAVGPSYLPGHAHADTLSFELSIGTERVLVNGGTSVYGLSAERQRQRGTVAHTTLSIDGLNSTDVWAGFRVGRRASPRVLLYNDGAPAILAADHDGYVHRRGTPRHKRQWLFGARSLSVTDSVSGSGTHRLEAWYHLHPAIKPGDVSEGLALRLPSGASVTIELPTDCKSELVPSTWHPGFGITVPSYALRVCRDATLPATIQVSFYWDA